MKAADRSQLLQALHTRRDTIAGSWLKAVTPTSFVPLSATEVRQRFIELTEQAIAFLLAEPFDRRQAEAIGASLVRLHYVQPEALGKTQEVLAHRLVEGLPADQVFVLQPRLAALLSGLAAGFFHQARETMLAEQEQIRSALITERKRAEETLQLRNRELALLNQVSQTLNSTLDPNQVFVAILEAMRDLMGVSACSIWLIDPASGEMVCQRAAGAQSEVVRGWRLAPGEGIAGWVARHGESVIVPDTREDERHCKSVGQQIGLEIRSLLSIPLKIRQDVIGVLEAVDTEAGRFDATHLTSLEPLAASAALAIENARVYEQAQQEITERKQAEEALRESERKYRTTLDSMGDAIHLVGPDLRFTLVNQAHQQRAKEFGSDTPDYIGHTLFEVFPFLADRAHDRLCAEYDQVFRTGETLITEESRPFGGTEFVTEVRKIPIFEKGRVTQVVTVIRDITERKRAEENLRKTTELLQSIMDSATEEMIIATDPTGTILSWNEGARRLLGYEPEEVVGKENIRIFHTEEYLGSGAIRLNIKTMIATGKPLMEELTYVSKDGKAFPAQEIVTPRFDEDGEFIGMLGLSRDITERKRAEEALRESEEKLRAQYKGIPVPTYTWQRVGDDFVLVDYNDAAVAITQGKVADRVGTKARDRYQDDPEILEEFSRCFTEKTCIEREMLYRFKSTAESKHFAVKYAFVPPDLVLVHTEDITERKQAEEALREHTGRLKTLHEIDSAILAAHSLKEIAQAALLRIRQLVPCQRASVVLFGLEASEGTILAAHGYSQAMPGEGERLSLGARAVAELRQGEVYVLHNLLDLPQPPPTIQALQAEGLHSCACVPLISHGELIGSLNLWTESPGSLALEQTDIAWEVADSLAIAIQHTRLFESVRQQGEHLRTLAARLAETEETERRQMARELHDQVGQNLTALGINLNLVRTHMPEETPALARSRLDDSLALVEETIERTRDVMANLRPPILDDYGLVATLHWYTERLVSWAGLSVTVHGEEPVPRLAAPTESALFRIAQEALTNVCKHAQATQVTVTVTADEEAVSLVIADDGVGFDPAQLTTLDGRRGWGLVIMSERAEAVGGHYRIESRPQHGTRVIVEVAR